MTKFLQDIAIVLAALVILLFLANTASRRSFDENYASTVMIEGNSVGSGIVVNENYIITALHVVRSHKENKFFAIPFDQKNSYQIEVYATDEATDLALLRYSSPDQVLPTAKFACTTPNLFTDVYAIGNPANRRFFVSKGIVTSKKVIGLPMADDFRKEYHFAYTLSLPIYLGNSGGPVFEEGSGNVVGMIDAVSKFGEGFSPMAFAVKPQALCDFLDKYKIKYDRG